MFNFPRALTVISILGAIRVPCFPGMARYWITNCSLKYTRMVCRSLLRKLSKPRISIKRRSGLSDSLIGRAFAHFDSPDLPLETNVLWDQVWLDIRYQYPLRSEQSALAIRPKLAALGVRVLNRI